MTEKILIVDDDLDTLRLVGLMLQKQGYQIVAASNGAQGLEMAFAEIPDVILLDVMMPQMDGYEVAKRLRADSRTANIPILMFTAKSQLDDKVAGFEAGADDYLTKPTHPSELQAHVKALLARSSKTKGPAAAPQTGPIEEPGYTIGIIAARGGQGVTSIASNLASALQKSTSSKVIMAELRPGMGTLAIELNLPGSKGLTELLEMPTSDISHENVKSRLVAHPSGVIFLPASNQPKDAALASKVENFEMLASRLNFMARFIVLDLGCGLGVVAQKLIPTLKEIVVLVEPNENALVHARALIDDLLLLGVDQANIRVVANYRLRSELQLSVPQVQEKLKFTIDTTFTPAPELLHQATRLHTMAFLVQNEGLPNQQYAALAKKVEARAPKPA